MKSRCFYLSAAFMAAAGAVASAAVSMMPVQSYADNVEVVTLNAGQTLALFGDSIMFTDPNSVAGGVPYTDVFEFVAVGIVENCPYLGNRQYVNGEMVSATTNDIAGSGCLIYRTSYNGWANNLSSQNEISVSLNTFVTVENVDYFHFNLGFSSNEDYYRTNISNNYQAIMNSRGIYTLSNNTEVICPLTFSQGSTYGNMSNAYVTTTYIAGTNGAYSGFLGTNFQMNLTLENAVIVNDISVGQCNRVARPRLGNPAGVNDYTYLYITFPTLSDSWSSGGGGGDESSDSGEDSGGGGGIIEIPDYSEDIATIVEQLDTIISHDVDHFAQINSQMMGLITRFDGLNSRVDGVNSRLDTGNSQLYGVNSRLDAIKGAIDSLGGGQLDSRPSAGLENSAFDSAAENAFSNIAGMYENSEYKPETEQTGGFLYFVRSFITSGRLTGVFAVVALLMLLRYTIFEKGM